MTNPVTPRLGPWLVRNPLDQAASVILIQATPGWKVFRTHGSSGLPHLHQCQWWHLQLLFFRLMALYLAWSSGLLMSGFQTGPTPSQDKPKFGNFEDFEGLTGLTGFKRFLDTSVQPVRADQWSRVILNNLGGFRLKNRNHSLKHWK